MQSVVPIFLSRIKATIVSTTLFLLTAVLGSAADTAKAAINLGVGTLASTIVILLIIPASLTMTGMLESFDADATVDADEQPLR